MTSAMRVRPAVLVVAGPHGRFRRARRWRCSQRAEQRGPVPRTRSSCTRRWPPGHRLADARRRASCRGRSRRLRDEPGWTIAGRASARPTRVDAVHDGVGPARASTRSSCPRCPGRRPKWTPTDLPHRIARFTGVRVTQSAASDEKVKLESVPAPERAKRGVLSPLAVLSWGGRPPASPRDAEPAGEPPDDAA